MALNNYVNNPEYPDRYARNKRWVKILPRAGRPIQSAELTEIQSLVLDNLKQGFNTLFRNGSAIKGLRISVSSRSTDTVTISVSEGQLYLEGIILDTQFTTLVIPAEGIYDVFVEVTERIVTEVDDPSLNDPIRGSFVLGSPGASRLVWNTTVNFAEESVNTNNAYSIGQVVNGIVLQKELNPFFEIQNLMAKFVFERSGNFCVEGLTTSYIGLSRRSVANSNKFEELQNQLTNAKNEQQNILSNALAAQQLVFELTQQHLIAVNNARSTQSLANQAVVANLDQQLKDAKADFASFSSQLVSAQGALQTAETEVKRSENLVTDQQILSVSPGVAYIEGYRVAINSPTQLFIPQSLPTISVEAATYTYRGISAQSVRTFSTTADSGFIEQPTGTSTVMYIQINNVEVNRNLTKDLGTNSFNVEIHQSRDGVSPTTVPGFIEGPITPAQFLAEFVRDYYEFIGDGETRYVIRDNQVVGNPQITQYTDGTPLGDGSAVGEDNLKRLLQIYIDFFSNGNQLIFKATPAVINGQELNIVIDSYISNGLQDTGALDVLSPISTLQVDVANAPLNQPISTSTYQLGFRPVNKVERLVANLIATNVQIVRSEQNGGFDEIPEDTVVRIVSIVQPGSGLTFVEGQQYRLRRDGRGIDWLVNNQPTIGDVSQSWAPLGGSTYLVTFEYTEPLVQETDYILNTATDTIEFIGRTPSPNSQFTVDYSYFLSKAGVITIDKNGRLDYLLSAAAKNPVPPTVPTNLLPLSSFKMTVNDVEVTKLDCRRQTVEELYDLSERVRLNSVNNAALKLDIETLNNSVAANRNPIAVFTDALVDVSKLDEARTTADIVPSVQAFMLPSTITEIAVSHEVTGTNATIITNKFGNPDYAIMPYTNVTFFNQPRATDTRQVPAISPTINKRARLYINKPLSFLNNGQTNISPCDPITKAGNSFINQTNNSTFVQDIVNNVRVVLGPVGHAVMESFESGRPVTVANTKNNNDFVVKAFNDRVCRQEILTIRGEGLPPNTPGFKLYLDGALHSNYTLINGTVNSTVIGTVNGFDGFTSKFDGRVHLRVTIPPELPTGTHTLSIKRDGFGFCKTNFYVYNTLLNHITLGPIKAWNALPLRTSATKQIPVQPGDFFSEHIFSLGVDPSIAAQTLDPTITVADTAEKAFPPKHFAVNQTFTSVNDYFLTQVKLKIADQPVGNDDQLNVYLSPADTDLPRREIKEVATASTYTSTVLAFGVPGIQTTFDFDVPQLINRDKRYSIGLENYAPVPIASNYQVYTGVIDRQDIVTGDFVGEQLYLDGDLFTSTDGSTLKLEGKEDLTMELVRADFDTVTPIVVNLGNYVTTSSVDYFCVNTRDIIPIGTEIIYKYRPSGATGDYIPFKPNIVICLNASIPGVEIIAELRSNLSTVSPMLLLNGSSVTLYNSQDNAEVISRLVTFDEYYTKVYITLEYIQPGDSEITVYYSPTRGFAWEGVEWWTLDPVPGTTQLINQELQLYRTTYFRDVGSDTAQLNDPEGRWYIFTDDRKFFRYKIEMEQNTSPTSPLVRKIESEVTQ